MQVTVRFFAAARERARRSTFTLELPAQARVRELCDELVKHLPELAVLMPQLRVAVDEEFVTLDATISPDAEVALIPPVAGGSGALYRVQDTPLSLAEVVEAVSGPTQGGVVTFSGVVRNHAHGKSVTRLEYEAYGSMAQKKLAQIGEEARAKWPGTAIAVVHRVGALVPGDLAVVMAVSAPHRAEAFRACEYVIDRLKEDVPIWKKEFGEGGEVWVGLGP